MNVKKFINQSKNAPILLDTFFKPWNEWSEKGFNLWGFIPSVPIISITKNQNEYQLSLMMPGISKRDYVVDINEDTLTVTFDLFNDEYGDYSYSRSFSIPYEVNKEDIRSRYENGSIKLVLPR